MDLLIEKAVGEFVGKIKQTSEYRDYILQREQLKLLPELYRRVNEYRRKNYEIQNTEQPDDLFESVDGLEKEFETLRENPVVDGFLSAELAFCRMMQAINVLITEELDFEYV